MFMGEYQHHLDDKGRLIMPAKFRQEIGQTFVLTKGFDGCLFGFALHEWQTLERKLQSLPMTNKDARAISRFFFGSATQIELDKQGRMQLAPALLTYANLERECVIVGVGTRIEIWNTAMWHAYNAAQADDMNAFAENLMGFDL